MVVQYSFSIQIQDIQIGNNRGVDKDYHLLGCETKQLGDVFENIVPPSSRSQGFKLLVSSLLQPQMGRFITRYGIFSVDANNLLSANCITSQHLH